MTDWQPLSSLVQAADGSRLRAGQRVWWQAPEERDLGGRVLPAPPPLNGVVKSLRGAFTIVYFGKLGDRTVPTGELTPTDDIVIYD